MTSGSSASHSRICVKGCQIERRSCATSSLGSVSFILAPSFGLLVRRARERVHGAIDLRLVVRRDRRQAKTRRSARNGGWTDRRREHAVGKRPAGDAESPSWLPEDERKDGALERTRSETGFREP